MTAKYPTQEMYGLTNQMCRAAISIASNLAESYGRRRYKAEYIHFLIYAQASCDETIEWIEYVRDCYKDLSNEAEELLKTMNELGRKLNRFIQSVETKHQFEVKQGEILGIIGRNGAGKSTLLKILSRVTTPTKGERKIKGRVASLLEVGTGFYPELTGREKIYLNGAILGMTKDEIKRKFDEIVAFAEVEKFIDTPVKRYSSGMYVRLAFAVAAHLEPEILLVK